MTSFVLINDFEMLLKKINLKSIQGMYAERNRSSLVFQLGIGHWLKKICR